MEGIDSSTALGMTNEEELRGLDASGAAKPTDRDGGETSSSSAFHTTAWIRVRRVAGDEASGFAVLIRTAPAYRGVRSPHYEA